ncbi:AraC family transcriptional regulator [Phyllobacterium endophyticum]|uniref:AraC family transcriptional regulator n=1 Tax=Phyllobacterium endophyticum TaxID=1149773 RepID=A0A2P7AR09_9HYPH|nr:AraC family transcriptional regulator [Phyllobacterium endophyticum]MBB3237011.1 AraC-like DNA-binding protein [Phyllobacterium endophyticum]PSH56583.1 AraC family transcriptional regulator [Phyllobacterium endophyticum]TYR44419.1 helix-turn-helix transcriptional regulator [Phyllobacterium endophyticum]
MTICAPQHSFKVGDCRTTSHQQRSWHRVEADLVRRTGLAKEETAITSSRHLVLLNVQGNSERGQYFIDGRNAAFVRRKPGAILFVPAGCNWQGWEAGASTAAYLSILVQPAHVVELLAGVQSGALASLAPDLGFEDPIILNAARGIGAEMRERNPLSALLVESYTATIFAQLMRRQKSPASVRKGGLAPANLNRVIEKIDDDLAGDLSLLQLAILADLSVPHFCRAFRQTLGCPPYAYIIRRRIERAKDYLRHSSMPVTDIALSCGFSSSSHFSNAFRREVGTTPLAYRATWPCKAQ